jgi:hypothetical protein
LLPCGSYFYHRIRVVQMWTVYYTTFCFELGIYEVLGVYWIICSHWKIHDLIPEFWFILITIVNVSFVHSHWIVNHIWNALSVAKKQWCSKRVCSKKQQCICSNTHGKKHVSFHNIIPDLLVYSKSDHQVTLRWKKPTVRNYIIIVQFYSQCQRVCLMRQKFQFQQSFQIKLKSPLHNTGILKSTLWDYKSSALA